MVPNYKPSYQYTWSFLPLIPALMGVLAVLAGVYQVVVHYVPIVKLNLFICVIFGVAVGYVTMSALALGKVRHPILSAAVAGLMGLFAIGVGHYVEYRMATWNVTQPVSIAEYLEFRLQTGWSLGKIGSTSARKSDVVGMGVYSIWAIEAVCLVGCATAAGYWGAFDPFCEKCKLWLKTDPRATVEFAHVPDDVMARVSAATSGSDLVRAVSGLTPSTAPKGFKPEADKTYTSLTYVMRCCQTCDETNLLSVKTRVEQKGREEETWICGNSTISHDEALEVATKAGKAT